MVSSKTHISIVVGSLILVVALLFLSPQTSYTQPGQPPGATLDVNVMNDETNPVPTTVENEESSPVPTYDVDRQEIEPHQAFVNFDIPAGSLGGSEVITRVPDDKRLVIEYVSLSINLPNPHFLTGFGIRIPDGTVNFVHDLPFPDGIEDEFRSERRYSFGVPLRLYAGPGRQVTISASRNQLSDGTIGDEASVHATISGFFIPCDRATQRCE